MSIRENNSLDHIVLLGFIGNSFLLNLEAPPLAAVKNSGNIARQTLTVPGTSFVQSYRYDSVHRLTEAVEKTGSTTNWSQQFGYDRYGNRTSFAQDIGGIAKNTTPAVDANTNRFTSTDFGYDANGNVIGDIDEATNLPRQFIFNGDNKQTEVKRDGMTIGRYFYDGEGRRVKKVTDNETTVFVYAAGQLIAEYSTAISQTPSVSYTTADHLGSPRVITNELGQVISRRDFLPFGEEINSGSGGRTTAQGYGGGDSIRQKFTGYERDVETDLDFAKARYYNHHYGRFTSPDPILESAQRAAPQSWNRYVYGLNNPLRYIDPLGENYEDLTDKQKKLIDEWAKRQNEANKTNLTAQEMYDSLGEDQRATFEAVANALENTTIIGKDGTEKNGLDLIKSVTFINGDKNASGEEKQRYRLFVELVDGAKDFVMTARNFKDVRGHDGFPDSRQLKGGEPSIQISMTRDGKSADIDVDYQSKKIVANIFNGFKHLYPSNSDVRNSDHFDKHNKRFGGGAAGPLRRRYEPKKPK